MSTGSVSDDSSNDDSGVAISDQLIDAIQAGDLENLRALLTQEDEGGRFVVTDNDIHEAPHQDAVAGSVGACRLLWQALSPRGKRMYFKATYDGFGTLHIAVCLGRFEVVRLFIEEFKWNINKKDCNGETPLCYAVQRQEGLEMARFLLENGANVNPVGVDGPLCFAVRENNTEVCRLLLMEYQANPNLNRRPVDEEDAFQQQHCRNTDNAIMHGNAEILRMLLEHGAFVGYLLDAHNGTSLHVLLCNERKSLETKLSIASMLIEHTREDSATAAFMQASFEFAIKLTGNECCQILLDAGIDRRTSMHCAIRAKNLSLCQLLVNVYQVDPFLQEEEYDNDGDETAAASPFLAAARLQDTTVLEYFLGLWDNRFAFSGGKNSDGDYPLHVVCCNQLVSLQAIELLVDRQADVLAMVDGEQGLLPFHFAANWGASLDVIFYLLQHCPEALRHVGGNAAVGQCPLSAAGDTNDSTLESSCNDDDVQAYGPVQKKAKTK